MSIFGKLRDINRLLSIATVLAEEELGFLVEKLNLSYLIPHKRYTRKLPSSTPKHLRKAMERLGGAFVKLGQLLSLRPDLIPKEYSIEFSKLQDNVQSFKFEDVKYIIESELKKPLNEIFKSFDKNPVAAASVGQVHKAVLKTGETVAVKVQRPNIKKVFAADIDILYSLAKYAKKHVQELEAIDPEEIIHEFEEYTAKELDYLKEASNIAVFYKSFSNDKNLKIPKPYWELTTSKVLTMEFIEGRKITEVPKNNKIRKKVADIVTDSFLKQVLEIGTFHADPHPGNIFVTKDGKVALLDFGIVGHISSDLREKVEDTLIALILADRNLLANSLIDLGIAKKAIPIEEFKEDLSNHLSYYYDKSLKQISISSALYDSLSLARKYNLKLPPNFVLLGKAMATVEGFDKEIYPDFNFVKACKPKVAEILAERTSPEHYLHVAKTTFADTKRLARHLPRDIHDVLEVIKNRKFKIDLNHRDVKKFSLEIDRSSNRITFGVIIAALIVAAALVIQAKLPPFIYGMPLLSLLSIGAALFLSFSLLISIEKEGRI